MKYLENYMEIDLEPRVTLMNRTAEDLNIFATHYAFQILLRKDLTSKFFSLFREAAGFEREVLERWMEVAEQAEQSFISKFKLDYFEIDSY